ncbi:MAG: VCBS repeat-containing protein [Bdellovibrionales bacterium]|nr:VCBS repeat-containing protein [Bdellovibrionales bacterium]
MSKIPSKANIAFSGEMDSFTADESSQLKNSRMGIPLGSNSIALHGITNLNRLNNQLSDVFERLSSGLRINHASDDPAGLAVATKTQTDSQILAQGTRNLNDGISLLNIADAALSSLGGIVTRLTELAEEAGNGALSYSQRKVLNEEAQSLATEYFRIAQSTKFESRYLLDGSMQSLHLQTGTDANGGFTSNLGGVKGTGTFSSSYTFTASANTWTPQSGDFDGDGILDLASVSSTANAVFINHGNGDGTFAASISYALGAGATAQGIALGDFNNDGILDISTANTGNFSVGILLGNGNGTFKAQVTYTATGVFSNVVGDVNNDGNLDVIFADQISGDASILLGNGDGTFAVEISTTAKSSSRVVLAEDFNGDGILDLTDGKSFHLGNGDGTFVQSQTTLNLGLQSGDFADFNGDGIVDLISAPSAGHHIIYLGNGDGTFSQFASIGINTSAGVLAEDFNGDGIVDLAKTETGTTAVKVYLGNGDGTFSFSACYFMAGDGKHTIAADYTNDGVFDLLSFQGAVNKFYIFKGNTEFGVGPILPFDLSTQAGALQALPMFERKVDQISVQRGQVGGFLSRTESALRSTQSLADQFQAAYSRIVDVDVAADTAELTRLQILSDANTAILAQANLQLQLVLDLLG